MSPRHNDEISKKHTVPEWSQTQTQFNPQCVLVVYVIIIGVFALQLISVTEHSLAVFSTNCDHYCLWNCNIIALYKCARYLVLFIYFRFKTRYM